MTAQALEQSVLESKDKDQLLAIAKALGLKASARTQKADGASRVPKRRSLSFTTGQLTDGVFLPVQRRLLTS